MLSIDLKYAMQAIDKTKYEATLAQAKEALETVLSRTGKGNDFLGWLDLPNSMDSDIERILKTAKRIKESSDVLVVIGIGGSYLGAKAALEALRPYFDRAGLEVLFAGHQMSSQYLVELKEYLKDKRFSINVISKSGTTTEPALAFRVFKELLEAQVGKEEASKRIVATTDESKGALRFLAEQEGYETYVIPDDVGGRYSILTAVGLLPLACADIDVKAMVQGAQKAKESLENTNDDNVMLQYVAARNALYSGGRKIEMFIHYEERLGFLAEWWKQLFGESEGKDGKGLFIASAGFTTDLHSLGQYIQEGERHLFETVVSIKKPNTDLTLKTNDDDLDGLNYLAGLTVDEVNKQAMLGTLLAHTDGDVPNIVLELDTMDATHFGYLIYFYELSCAVSGYVLDVNPFDQPGVEAYKKNMFALLEKPGFEEASRAIKARLKK